MDINQAATEIKALTTQVAEIKEGVNVLLQRVADLTAVIEAGGGTTPEFDAALQAMKAQVSEVRGLVPTVEA